MITQTPMIHCFENSWCILMFILLALTLILDLFLNSIAILKIIAEAAILNCCPKVIPKANFLIVKVDFKKQHSNLKFDISSNVQLFWQLENHLVLCFISHLRKRNKNHNFIFNFLFQFINKKKQQQTKQNKTKQKKKNNKNPKKQMEI